MFLVRFPAVIAEMGLRPKFSVSLKVTSDCLGDLERALKIGLDATTCVCTRLRSDASWNPMLPTALLHQGAGDGLRFETK